MMAGPFALILCSRDGASDDVIKFHEGPQSLFADAHSLGI